MSSCFSSVVVLLTTCILGQSLVQAQSEEPSDSIDPNSARDLQRYDQSIKPLLESVCFDCHSGDDVEGNFSADQLDPDLVNGEDIAWWLEVYSVLSKGEMPPPDSIELEDEDRTLMVDWLSTQIQTAESLRKLSESRSSFRRLTRYEYNYALQDLFGVAWTFAGDLPAEASEEAGFENDAHSLHMSVKQVQMYHQLALKALRRVTVRGDRPDVRHWEIPMKNAFQREKQQIERNIDSEKKKLENEPDKLAKKLKSLNKKFQPSADKSHYLDLTTGLKAEVDWDYRKATYAFPHNAFPHNETFRAIPDPGSHVAVVQPGSRQDLTVELGDGLPNKGIMRVRVRASRAEGVVQRIPSLQLSFGFRATDQGAAIERVSSTDMQIDASYGQPQVYQWEIPLSEIEHRNTYRGEKKLGEQPSPSEYIQFTNSTVKQSGDGEERGLESESPAILIDYVEVAAPVYADWPPPSHRRVFIDSVDSQNEVMYAGEIIADFMARAWRHPPLARDIDRKLQLFQRLRPASTDFQEAILEVLATVLTSPKFLYVLPSAEDGERKVPRRQSSQYELATRLSLFLWCSLPDEKLLKLAAEGRLSDHDALLQQVDRMLADTRAERFNKHFVEQWLRMQPLEFVTTTRDDNGLDEALLESMKREPIALFRDMLHRDSSVLDFIAADYLVVDERLAKHYGIAEVQGNEFRRVDLPAEFNRGGLLTQAGLLVMNSDGEDSHPVKRGVWLLTNLLNDPPPPPPPAVPEIDLSDPAIAKMTLKERIEDHRNHAACLSCHQKIDPWGIAFENYDAMGRWRVQIDGKIVDAESVLPDQTSLDGMNGLKEHLLQDRQEQFVRATVEKLASFALGRQLDFADRAAITKITNRVRESGDGITTMIKCLVSSELFQTNE